MSFRIAISILTRSSPESDFEYGGGGDNRNPETMEKNSYEMIPRNRKEKRG